jgi:hypothetical protein
VVVERAGGSLFDAETRRSGLFIVWFGAEEFDFG